MVTVEAPRNYPVDLRTSGGSLDVRDLNASVRGKTSGGGITLLLPQNTHASIDAETSGGSVTSDLPVTTTRFARDHLQGTIGGGGAQIYLRTSGGGIHVGPLT